MAHLHDRLDPGLAGRALGDDENPDGLDGSIFGFGNARGPATEGRSSGLDRIERIRFATASALGSIRPVDLDHLDVGSTQEAGQAGPIGAGALHPDLGHLAEALEPGQQRLVATRVRLKALGAEECSKGVEGGSYMDVEVGVDATGHSTRSFYDGHGHPFLSQWCEGWHGRSGSERRAVQVVVATRTNHPNSETGRAAFNVRCRPNLPAIPKLLTTSNAAVDGADHCHCSGAGRGLALGDTMER